MKRQKPLQRKPIRQKSKKREVIDAKRRKFLKKQRALRIYCEAGPKIGALILRQHGVEQEISPSVCRKVSGCLTMATEFHEPLTRARAPGAETILDENNSVAICAICHRWVHENDELATGIGLLVSTKPSIKDLRDADESDLKDNTGDENG